MSRRRALLASTQSQNGGGIFPVYLTIGDNGELGIAVFNYFKENYSFGLHILDNSTQVYIDNTLMSYVLVTGNVTFDNNYLLLSNGYCDLQSQQL